MKKRQRLKRIGITALTALMILPLYSQDITLEECEQSALLNHPLSQQTQWINLTEQSDISSSNAQYLPKMTLSGKATTQSDAISATIGTVTLNGDVNQFQLVGEVSQILIDGGAIKAGKEALVAESEVKKGQIAVGLESLRSAVRETYFSVLLLNSQLDTKGLLKDELTSMHDKMSSYYTNGLATLSDVDAIEIEQLNVAQQVLALQTKKENALYSLSRLSGIEIAPDAQLLTPEFPAVKSIGISPSRKEFALFQSQLDVLDAQHTVLTSTLFPKVNVFAQAGYSEPALNMLDPNPSGWWIVGVRGTINLDAYYTYRSQTNKIEASKNLIGTQISQFQMEEEIKLHQKLAEIDQLEQTISMDETIIARRERIKESIKANIATGTKAASDLIQELDDLNRAQMLKAQHEIELLSAYSELSLIEGNGEL